jgi:hypothetical protein
MDRAFDSGGKRDGHQTSVRTGTRQSQFMISGLFSATASQRIMLWRLRKNVEQLGFRGPSDISVILYVSRNLSSSALTIFG